MTEYEYNELAAENDGYTNDYQRAFAYSCMTRKAQEARTKAAELVAAGRFVVVGFCPEHCPITDAVMGEHAFIVGDADTREGAHDIELRQPESFWDDCRTEIWPRAEVVPVAKADDNDDIPF